MLTTTVCVALSAAGLAIALLTAYRRRFLAATRIAAFALIPVGLAMAGLADLAKEIGVAAGDWAKDLVLKPAVWGGFGVLAVSALLLVVTRIAGRRRGGTRKERRVTAAERGAAVAPAASAPALGASRTAGQPQSQDKGKRPASGSGDGLEDFQDIEAILKKHGI